MRNLEHIDQTCKNTLLIASNLLLGGSSLGLLVALALLAGTLVTGLGASVAELAVSTTLDWLWSIGLLDLGDTLGVDNWHGLVGGLDKVGLGSLDVLDGGISLLGLSGLAWEENEAGTVGLKTLDVDLEGLDGEVGAAWVNGDTDGGSELLWDTSLLLCLSELSTSGDPGYAIFRTLSSSMEKPRPARTRRLYLRVGQRTIGLSLSTGRGATAAALERRAFLRLSLRPGWSKWTRTRRCQSLRKSVYAISPPLLYACVVAGVCSRLCGICWLCLMAILSSVVGRRRKGPGNVRKKQYSTKFGVRKDLA